MTAGEALIDPTVAARLVDTLADEKVDDHEALLAEHLDDSRE